MGRLQGRPELRPSTPTSTRWPARATTRWKSSSLTGPKRRWTVTSPPPPSAAGTSSSPAWGIHPRRALDHLDERIKDARRADPELIRLANAILAVVAKRLPDEALAVAEKLGRLVPLGSLPLQAILSHRPLPLAEVVLRQRPRRRPRLLRRRRAAPAARDRPEPGRQEADYPRRRLGVARRPAVPLAGAAAAGPARRAVRAAARQARHRRRRSGAAVADARGHPPPRGAALHEAEAAGDQRRGPAALRRAARLGRSRRRHRAAAAHPNGALRAWPCPRWPGRSSSSASAGTTSTSCAAAQTNRIRCAWR